ncbi:hypothetical protein VTL71DRAFT_2172 [Oculimacula yallundae]|uniref:Uncharacterized protein n=1 Tax=Oculimacula yallundae TaxID=86028 RepID=A0ABR4C840_9HELO
MSFHIPANGHAYFMAKNAITNKSSSDREPEMSSPPTLTIREETGTLNTDQQLNPPNVAVSSSSNTVDPSQRRRSWDDGRAGSESEEQDRASVAPIRSSFPDQANTPKGTAKGFCAPNTHIEMAASSMALKVSNRNKRKYAAKNTRAAKKFTPAIEQAIDQAAKSLIILENREEERFAQAALESTQFDSPIDVRRTSAPATGPSHNESLSRSPSGSPSQTPSPKSSSWDFDRTINRIADAKGFSNKRRVNAKALMKADSGGNIKNWADRMRATNEDLRDSLDPEYVGKKAALAKRQAQRRAILAHSGETAAQEGIKDEDEDGAGAGAADEDEAEVSEYDPSS